MGSGPQSDPGFLRDGRELDEPGRVPRRATPSRGDGGERLGELGRSGRGLPTGRATDHSRTPGLKEGVPEHPTSGQQTSTPALDAPLDSLDEARLSQERVCHFTEGDRNSEARFPIGDVLWHLVEEELQHRGKLNALSWQLDIDPPIATVEDWNASKAVGNQG